MTVLAAYTLGWELEHPDVAPMRLDDAAAWSRAEVVFFSPLAVEQLWSHAVGERSRLFRSTRREAECWRGLLVLIERLQALLARGGHLIGRLDVPATRCRVRQRPDTPVFPPGSELNAYDAIVTADPRLAAVAQLCGRLPAPDFTLRPAGHPLDDYLASLEKFLHPRVALRDLPPAAEALAVSTEGYALAIVAGQMAWLPTLVAPQPRREAEVLVTVAARLLGVALDRSPRTPHAASAATTSAIERQERLLDARIAKLTAQRDALAAQREARTWLWSNLDAPLGKLLPEFVNRLVVATGRAPREPLTSEASTTAQRVRLNMAPADGEVSKPEVEFVELAIAGGPAKAAGSNAWGGLEQASTCVVPAVELRQALAASMMLSGGDGVLDRICGLWQSPGLWRFEPHELLLDAQEQAALGVTETPLAGD